MKKLSEQLWPIVKEYTRQVAEIMQCREWHWIGTNDDGEAPAEVLDLDGYYFLSWQDIQIIVDRIDEWVRRYVSKEGVAEEVQAWQNWWLGLPDDDMHPILDVWESRRERYFRTAPYITLEHWLMGCPREKREKTPHDHLRELKVKRELVKELTQEYRESRSLWNIIENLSADIKTLEAKVAKMDAEEIEKMKQSDAYKELVDCCIDATEDTEKTDGTEY